MTKTLVLCDCLGSQNPNGDVITKACGVICTKVHTHLCGREMETAAQFIEQGDVIIACGQEHERFADLATEIGAPIPEFVDIRDRAGWSDGTDASPKMAALIADALLPAPETKSVDVHSEGTCLIIGEDAAIAAAEALCDILGVTVLLPEGSQVPDDARFDSVVGRVRSAKGALGGFEVLMDGLQQIIPGGRGDPTLSDPRDGGRSGCDIILDLSGAASLFPAPEKREGYLRADPKSQPAVSAAILEASQLVGVFEKPLYVKLEPSLCAHSRAEQVACSNCLDICPTSAISPAGDHVEIDPMACAGCGSCAALCPSGAITYDAPVIDNAFKRISTLAETFRKAGGSTPRLLIHDPNHGAEMIQLASRHGRGLPADVIPMEVSALAGISHAEFLAALACGFAHVDILLSPRIEHEALEREAEIAQAVRDNIRLLDITDPEEMSAALYDGPRGDGIAPILPMGSKRQVARLAAKALQPEADMITLPDTAPYGAVIVDTDACTLCLSCVSLCPSGALGDNPDAPQLRFQEDACLQCGLCSNICPENAISYTPQLNLTETALTQVVLHEEEPFACIECGTLFGVKSTVERITEKLAGKHSMFANADAARMIQMCDNCRINAQFHSENNPFQGGDRPRTRTSDDYFSKRKDH